MVDASVAAEMASEDSPGTLVFSPAPRSDNQREIPDVRLVIARCPDSRHVGRTIQVAKARFTLGRDAGCDLVIDDPGWSRQHAAIEYRDPVFTISDLGSANGTFVNGRRLSAPATILLGSALGIGGTTLNFIAQDTTLPDLTGVQIADRYELRRLLRESAKAALYVAADKNVRREVALKLLSPAYVRYPATLSSSDAKRRPPPGCSTRMCAKSWIRALSPSAGATAGSHKRTTSASN